MHTPPAPVWLLAASLLMAGCDQSSFLGGQWVVEESADGPSADEGISGAALQCTQEFDEENNLVVDCERKWIELNLGHFGEQVVGTLRFYESPNRSNATRTKCTTKNQCCCQYIDARLRADAIRDFTWKDCAGDLHEGTISVVDNSTLRWTIGQGDARQTVTLVGSGQSTADDKSCGALE